MPSQMSYLNGGETRAIEGCCITVINNNKKYLFLLFKRHFSQFLLLDSASDTDWLVQFNSGFGILISVEMYWRRQKWNKLGTKAIPMLTN